MVDNYIKAGKTYKVFLVEEDDEDRERVLSALTNSMVVDYEPVYTDIDTMLDSAKIFKTDERVTLTIELLRRENGSYYTIEDFSAGEDPEDEE